MEMPGQHLSGVCCKNHLREVTKMDVKTTLDVCQVPPAKRHPLIFQTFEPLQPGEAHILVNDHDPKPLYYHFKFEREGQFTREYLEQGLVLWRVRIGQARPS